MHAPQGTVWDIPQLTPIKHHLLRSYLQEWFPTMLRNHERIHVIDGFSGPGEYTGGEPGSPLIAINTLMSTVPDCTLQRNVTFWFVDADERRRSHLHYLLRKQASRHPPLRSLSYAVRSGTFAEVMHKHLSRVETQHITLPPTFTFIDPFGVTDVPMSIIARLMCHPHNEVLITFMYEGANRCLAHPDTQTQQHLTTLLGTEQWRDLDLTKNREKQLCDLYCSHLQTIGHATYVCIFHLKSRGQGTDYYLVFGTHALASLEKMKDIFWEIDPLEGDTFEINVNRHQPSLFPQRHEIELAEQLQHHFKGRVTTLDEVEEYILAHTRFRRKDRESAFHYLEQLAHITMLSPNLSATPDSSTETARTGRLLFSPSKKDLA